MLAAFAAKPEVCPIIMLQRRRCCNALLANVNAAAAAACGSWALVDLFVCDTEARRH